MAKIRWGVSGCIACVLWVLAFGAGAIVDSCPCRLALAPGLVKECSTAAGNADLRASSMGLAFVAASSVHPTVSADGPFDCTQSFWRSFITAVVLYTPLNIALLALLAGFTGGCASVASYGRASGSEAEKDTPPEQPAPPPKRVGDVQAFFLSELPLASALRGFFVYLAVLGGVYTAIGNPFPAEADASQLFLSYLRLAGLVSFLAFVVGYDPTRIRAFLELIPGRGSS